MGDYPVRELFLAQAPSKIQTEDSSLKNRKSALYWRIFSSRGLRSQKIRDNLSLGPYDVEARRL